MAIDHSRRASKKLASLVAELETTIALTAAVVSQTRTRLGGQTPDGATRVVSLHDPDARPHRQGIAQLAS